MQRISYAQKKFMLGTSNVPQLSHKKLMRVTLMQLTALYAEKVDALSIHTSDFLVAKSSLTELNALNANADLIVAYVINVYGNCEAKKIIKVK